MAESGARRPQRLEPFGEVLGFVSLNGDSHVSRKLHEKGHTGLSYDKRKHLIDLAIEPYPWMHQERLEGERVHQMRDRWPKLNFIVFCMNGADDIVKYGKCSWSGPKSRFIAMGRPGYTDVLSKDMEEAGIDRDAGFFIMGPELEDVSSTLVREALVKGNELALDGLLDPRVTEWCIEHYRAA